MSKNIGVLILLMSAFSVAHGQGGSQLYVVDPYDGDTNTGGGIFIVDQQTGATTPKVSATVAAVPTEVIAMALDSADLETIYVVFESDGSTATRTLGTIDLSTGEITPIGLLGDAIADIAFDGNGQLYGITGDGGSDSSTFFSIDKSTGTITLIVAMDGTNGDGEALAFNPTDGMMYRISGNGTDEMTSINLNTFAINTVPVTTTITDNGEGLGMVFDEDLGLFIGTDRDDQLVTINPTTAEKELIGTDPALYARGAVFFPSKSDVIFYDGFNNAPPPPVR